jgi:hypothetical protein
MSYGILLLTATTLGLLGGLHCVAMCSAMQRIAIHGAGVAASAPRARRIPLQPVDATNGRPIGAALVASAMPSTRELTFHAARLAGYVALGAAAGGGSALLRVGAETLPAMRPLWGTANALLIALGLALMVLGRQPAWIDALAMRIATATGLHGAPTGMRPAAAGLAWALLPCGLLYTALATAALASDPVGGAIAMLGFGLGTAVNLLAAQALVRVAGARIGPAQSLGVRAGGALLAVMGAAALIALALGQPHPFCR